MKKTIITYLSLHKNVEFSIIELENHTLNTYESLNDYHDEGGYDLFFSIINELREGNEITPIKAAIKHTNNRKNPLPIRWKKIKKKQVQTWSKEQLFQVSDRLDISYYIQNPDQQDDLTWKCITSIHRFLGNADQWEWESNATRSYQLFEDEKYLNGHGRHLLGRLKLTESDLKIKQYGEPFSYFVNPRINVLSNIKSILIIENLSFFHSYRRLFKMQRIVVGKVYDMIIYAEGTHIESSIQYLDDILEHHDFKVHYVGDMDPSGYSIYARLKSKNPQYNIKLAKHIYIKMIEHCQRPTPLLKEQKKNDEHFDLIINEMDESELFKRVAIEMWEQNKRIPQEVLPIDVLLKGEGYHA